MGGQGSGRPPSPETIVKRMTQAPQTPIGDSIFLPNYSGLKKEVLKTDPTDLGGGGDVAHFTENADGFTIYGGTTERDLKVNGADVEIQGAGTATITFPSSTSTLATTSLNETLSNKTLTSPVINTSISGTAILDEDDMASNSATKLATQQSIKAYVDANAGGAQILYKTSDQSSTTTTMANVTDLSVSVSANTTYVFWGNLLFNADSATPDVQIDFTGPSGASFDCAYNNPSGNDEGTLTAFSTASDRLDQLVSTTRSTRIGGRISVGSTAGTLQLRFSQVSLSSTIYIEEGSFIAIQSV